MLIETERTALRPLATGDLDEFAALHSDPRLVRYIRALDRRQAMERLEACEREWAARGHGMLAVFDRASGRFLGRVGLRHWPQFGETEAGWLLRSEEWGHGYATEAGGACVDWGFETLPLSYVTAMINPANDRSIGVARRLGFRPGREDLVLGEPVVVHALTRESWSGSRDGAPASRPPGGIRAR
jgi:RimJ/RimL family protein N-acetyltransferase